MVVGVPAFLKFSVFFTKAKMPELLLFRNFSFISACSVFGKNEKC
jgi:hypothetical protein